MSVAPAAISACVGTKVNDGRETKNLPADVKRVKELLNAHSAAINLKPLLDPNSKDVGTRTIEAIKKFQKHSSGNPTPSGRITPEGPTIKALLKIPATNGSTAPGGGKVSGKTTGVLSGIIKYLEAVSAHYGKEIVVTSGKRSPEHQATVMWENWPYHLERGKIYAFLVSNSETRLQLDAYYNTGHSAAANATQKMKAKQDFSTKIVSIASKLSRHLTGEAVDIALGTDKRVLGAIGAGFTYVEEKYQGVVKCHHFDTRKFGKAPAVTADIKSKWPK